MAPTRIGKTGALIGLVLFLPGCGSDPLGQAEEECAAQVDGAWQGAADGEDLMVQLTSFSHIFGCHLRGSWRWSAQAGTVQGSMTRMQAHDSVHIMLVPHVTTCLLEEGIGEAELHGTLTSDAISGTLSGGSRSLPPSWACTDPSDTILAFDGVAVGLRRTS